MCTATSGSGRDAPAARRIRRDERREIRHQCASACATPPPARSGQPPPPCTAEINVTSGAEECASEQCVFSQRLHNWMHRLRAPSCGMLPPAAGEPCWRRYAVPTPPACSEMGFDLHRAEHLSHEPELLLLLWGSLQPRSPRRAAPSIATKRPPPARVLQAGTAWPSVRVAPSSHRPRAASHCRWH